MKTVKIRLVSSEDKDLNENEGLDLIINSKLRKIQELEDKISKLEDILQDLTDTYGEKVKVKVREPSMKELLQFCGNVSNAIKGKKTG